MCLINPDEKPLRKFGIGYKSVTKKKDGTYTNCDFRPLRGSVTYPLNKWLKDPQAQHNLDCGFHISLDKEYLDSLDKDILSGFDAVTIKVRFRKVIATGIEHPDSIYGQQVVAREIMNLEEV